METPNIVEFVRLYNDFLELDKLVCMTDNDDVHDDYCELEGQLIELYGNMSIFESIWIDNKYPNMDFL